MLEYLFEQGIARILLEHVEDAIQDDDVATPLDLVLREISDNPLYAESFRIGIFEHLPDACLGRVDAQHGVTVSSRHERISTLPAAQIEDSRGLFIIGLKEARDLGERLPADSSLLAILTLVLAHSAHSPS